MENKSDTLFVIWFNFEQTSFGTAVKIGLKKVKKNLLGILLNS